MKNIQLSFASQSNFGKTVVGILVVSMVMLPNLIILPKLVINSLLTRS